MDTSGVIRSHKGFCLTTDGRRMVKLIACAKDDLNQVESIPIMFASL